MKCNSTVLLVASFYKLRDKSSVEKVAFMQER